MKFKDIFYLQKKDRQALLTLLAIMIVCVSLTFLIQEKQIEGYGVHILFVNWDMKPEPGTWADKWLTGMGYHQDEPNDPRPFHYYMMHKRLVDSY